MDGATAGGSRTGAVLGQLLRRYRQRARLTQEELAERSGYSTDYISKLERDRRQPPLEAIDRLAAALELGSQERDELRAARARAGPTLPPLAGRVRELAQIDRHLAGLGAPVLMLAGEPGIGKTRLLDEAAVRGAANGWRIVSGGCKRRGQDPYEPLTDALAHSIRQLRERERASVLDGSDWLGLLLPELLVDEHRGPNPSVGRADPRANHLPPEQQRRLLYAAVGRYLRRVAGPAGTLLVLDDLQWAGGDALDLLDALVTSAESPPIRLVAAYRDSEVTPGSPLAGLVADLARASLVNVISLGPLSEIESEQLLTDLVAEGTEPIRTLVPAIRRRAGGVPFFLVSYVEELRARPDAAAHALELPWNVAQVIRQREHALPGAVQELLGIAAVVGRVVPRDLLNRVTAIPEDQVLVPLEEAAMARLLVEDGEGDYRFTHDLIRETVEYDLSAGRRQLLHRRIGEALEQSEQTPMEALAYHFGRSDDRAKALRYLERAGDEAQQRFAHAAAAEYFRAALERRASEGRLSDVAPLREKLGTALLSAARYDEALTMFEQSLNDYRAAGDEDGVRRVTGLAAEAHFHRGTGHDLIGHISELAARSAPGGAGSESLGELVLRQGLLRLLFGSGAYRQMLVLGRALARIGRTTRNAGLLAAGERAQGAALIYLGRLAEGAAMLDAALRDSPTAGRHAHATEIGPILGAAYLVMGALDRGQELSRQLLHLAQAQNNPILVATHTVFLGTAHYLAGNWASGRAFLQRSDELFAAVGPTSLAVRTIGVRVIPLIWEGEWVEARRRLETSLERARAMRLGPAERQASAYLAELDVREGRPQSAVARLAPLQHSELTWVDAGPVLSALAWAYLELGDLEQAQALAQRSVAETERTGARFFGITARRVRGMIEARQGDTDRARATFAEGLRLARSMPCPYEEARLLEALGQLERQQNNLAVANENLEQGRAIFERLGARMDLQFHRRDGEGARG